MLKLSGFEKSLLFAPCSSRQRPSDSGQLSNGALKPHTNTPGSARLNLVEYEQTGEKFTSFIWLGFLSPTLIHFCGYGCVFLIALGHWDEPLQNVNIQACELVWSIVLTWPCAKLWFNWHECETCLPSAFKPVSQVPLRKTTMKCSWSLCTCLSSDSCFSFCYWQLDECRLVCPNTTNSYNTVLWLLRGRG